MAANPQTEHDILINEAKELFRVAARHRELAAAAGDGNMYLASAERAEHAAEERLERAAEALRSDAKAARH